MPKGRDPGTSEIPVTYVPARNTIFLSHSLALAEVTGSHNIFIGVNALDYSGYPDCRPDYIYAFERMANLATKAGAEQTSPVRIQAPLITLTKAEIITRGMELGVDFGATMSCYDPPDPGMLCTAVPAMLVSAEKGFAEAGRRSDELCRLTPPTLQLLVFWRLVDCVTIQTGSLKMCSF